MTLEHGYRLGCRLRCLKCPIASLCQPFAGETPLKILRYPNTRRWLGKYLPRHKTRQDPRRLVGWIHHTVSAGECIQLGTYSHPLYLLSTYLPRSIVPTYLGNFPLPTAAHSSRHRTKDQFRDMHNEHKNKAWGKEWQPTSTRRQRIRWVIIQIQ